MFPGDKYDLESVKAVNKYKYVRGLLLVVASIALAIIVFWPNIRDYFETPQVPLISQETQAHKVALSDAQTKSSAKYIRFHGADKSNQPYTLIADDGDENTNGLVLLTKPHLTLNLASGNTATLTAIDGVYDKNKELITLKGGVVVTHSNGYQFVTSLAWIDLTQSISYGDKPVHGEGPAGTINAQKGFRLSDNGDKFIFFGRPELILKSRKKP
ncbi:LPS export ABC transporter periplasmic protein LptC [Candidatus Paracaedibacter symbiosus]|uniref:LPS export ABC transporter periplasmic protein LptC n=1 Tax=Candidatus Paracaedibacter symbiosus TaxID=244582 RepID=UPI000509652A|nr:LPS export ABC transporter periplasmic protein LptC [Candidatus Paracaedibacter symbiosus]